MKLDEAIRIAALNALDSEETKLVLIYKFGVTDPDLREEIQLRTEALIAQQLIDEVPHDGFSLNNSDALLKRSFIAPKTG